ncbi:MAG: hypothetical protein QM764_20405 [Chitinophagaceae bacterium]
MENFKYKPAIAVKEWGCHFDSLLELKYALSIYEEYEFLRSRIPIYFDPKTKKPTDYLRYNTRRYMPDFLIRHKISGEACWVEIKPRVFENEKQLILRTSLAEQYIKWKSLDWTFKVVYDDEIFLESRQQEMYNSYYKYKRKSLGGFDNKKERAALPIFNMMIDSKKIRFLMYGYVNPLKVPSP